MTALSLVQRPFKRKQKQKPKLKRPKRFAATTIEITKTISSHGADWRTPLVAAAPAAPTARNHSKLPASTSPPGDRKCQQFALFVVSCLLLTLETPTTNADWLMECGSCHCKWNSGKKTADCKNLTLKAVPENLSPDVQVLDLSHNHIPHLEPNAFLRAQLHNLHKLYIRNASMLKIDPRCFTQLEILIELDLSNNLLRALQPNQFGHLVKVRALLLNGNLLETLGNGIFQNLNYLHRLELKSNRLTRIATQVFVNLPMLSQIYLDENRLNFLRKDSFEQLKRLTALSLDQNPWNCTCELQVFRDFVLERNLYTPPTACYFPPHLRGMLWIEDQPEAFACKPKIIYPAKGASINTSKENVTLICRVHAAPKAHITWNHNKQIIRANTAALEGSQPQQQQQQQQQQRIHIQLLRDENIAKEKSAAVGANLGRGAVNGDGFGRNMFISRLTITNADKSDEGIYTCSAENAGGKDSVQMSLFVESSSTTAKDFWLFQGNLVIVIALLALGLLSVSFFLTMVTCCLYKRLKSFNGLTPHHHQHHRNHHNHHHHSDTQLTTSAGNVIVESTAIDAGEACGSGSASASTGSSSGIISSSAKENGKTTTVGNYHHLVKQHTTANSNKTTKKYTNCLLRDDNSYIVSNANTELEIPRRAAVPPSRHFNKDTKRFPPSYELSPELDINKQPTWTKNNINNRDVLLDNVSAATMMTTTATTATTLRKEYRAGSEFQPDLLSAYSNSKVNS